MNDTDKVPSIIAGYLEELRVHTASGGTYAYRGQGNAKWRVESAAYRRLKKSDGNPPDWERFLSYHREQILEPARMNGYGFKDGKELSDLELLAELQHYGAATCLIDFTRDFLVALWFACQTCKDEQSVKQAGKVLILNINGSQRQTSYLVALCSMPILLGVARVMNKLRMTEWMQSCVKFRAQNPKELVPGYV